MDDGRTRIILPHVHSYAGKGLAHSTYRLSCGEVPAVQPRASPRAPTVTCPARAESFRRHLRIGPDYLTVTQWYEDIILFPFTSSNLPNNTRSVASWRFADTSRQSYIITVERQQLDICTE